MKEKVLDWLAECEAPPLVIVGVLVLVYLGTICGGFYSGNWEAFRVFSLVLLTLGFIGGVVVGSVFFSGWFYGWSSARLARAREIERKIEMERRHAL